MRTERPGSRDVAVAAGLGLLAAAAVLVAVAVASNGPRVWDTAAFCGSYAEFRAPPVPAVCLSFPTYLLLSVGHPPHAGPALLVGLVVGSGYLARGRRSDR